MSAVSPKTRVDRTAPRVLQRVAPLTVSPPRRASRTRARLPAADHGQRLCCTHQEEAAAPAVDSNHLSRALWRLLGHWIVWSVVPMIATLLRALHCSCVPLGYELHRPSWNNCSAPNVRTVLTANPYVECYDADGIHGLAANIAILGLLLIFFVLPTAAFLLPDIEKRQVQPAPRESSQLPRHRSFCLSTTGCAGVAQRQHTR